MDIKVSSKPVVVAGPEVIFTFADSGGAHTRALVTIEDVATIQNNAGPQSKVVLATGKTYRCGIVVMALKHMALNAHYNITVKADDTTIAQAKGNIPAEEPSEFGKAFFDLTVVAAQ